jgi:hypothetical protein
MHSARWNIKLVALKKIEWRFYGCGREVWGRGQEKALLQNLFHKADNICILSETNFILASSILLTAVVRLNATYVGITTSFHRMSAMANRFCGLQL